MKLPRRSLRLVALAVVVTLPFLGVSGVASAKVKSTKHCHKTHSCKKPNGAGAGSGGPTSAPITVQVDPNPLVETGQSFVVATIQVETSPSFAGDAVNIDSSQLSAACSGNIDFFNLQNGSNPAFPNNPPVPSIQAILDDDGNATVLVVGYECAPGTSLIEADLTVAPFFTALTELVANPPAVTPVGVTGYPATSGTATTGEVETGDTNASGDSDVYGVFYVETDPVYAEQTAEISSSQLQDRCITGWNWFQVTPVGATQLPPPPATQIILDDDGNAVFVFMGTSCAAGPSEVIADILAGSHPTYTTTFTVLPPQPTI